jgi:hypothetical protein
VVRFGPASSATPEGGTVTYTYDGDKRESLQRTREIGLGRITRRYDAMCRFLNCPCTTTGGKDTGGKDRRRYPVPYAEGSK